MNLNKKDTNLHYYHCDLTVKVCELKQQPSLASYLHVTTTMNCCSTFFRFDRLLKVVMMMMMAAWQGDGVEKSTFSCVLYDSYSFSFFWLSAFNSLTFSLFTNPYIKVAMIDTIKLYNPILKSSHFFHRTIRWFEFSFLD